MKFLKSLVQTFANKPIDWDDLEESLIRADLGLAMTTRIIKTLQEREAWSLMGISDVVKVVREEIARILPANSPPITPEPGKPKVILLVGVNGTGKTTSTAKLGRYLQQEPEWIDILFCWRQPILFAPLRSDSSAFGPNGSALK